ncbi:response regulator receiver sensor signal transduction histidine kinase [Leptolyngbya sp. Heron Island J]|uniref:PAS domain S-box protein n=1 Tax=Leptolyngbya sp. Heron Island J TaxID=1385935 RepID=UPI0003B9D4A5|nr:PAS domain S-box protein [Leptolyngbya sp. Heron Island J]ESA36425.1 response regulator receiver sensor signal transduction histidine kinase [Leptolyngbya sp. Heron Island J]
MSNREIKILVVDDQLTNVSVLTEVLSSAGYTVASALSSDQALQTLRSLTPDLILLDIEMPGIDGFTTCQQIKAKPRTAHIPIIFITASSDTESVVKGFSVGAVDFIRTPFQEPELLARVQTHLQLRHVSQLYKLEQQKNEELTQLNNKLLLTQFSVDNAADGIVWIDQNSRFFYANKVACNLLEYSLDELTQLSVPDIDVNFSLRHWRKLWHTIKKSKNLSLESQHRTKSGRLYSVEITVNYLSFAEQECNVVVFRDISDRKQVEAELQLSQARTTAAFEQAAVGFAEVDMATQKFTKVNTLFCDMIGYSEAELSELTFADLTYPDDIALSRQAIQQLYSGAVDNFTIEKRYLRKDGSWFWAETTVYLVKLRGEQAIYSLALIQDISQRKRLEAERVVAEKALSLAKFAIDHTATSTFWINQDGYFLSVNKAACQSLEYSPTEFTSMAVWDITPTFSQDDWPAHWQSLKQHQHQQLETFHQTKSGRIFPVEIVTNFLEFEGEQYNFARATDISARKAAEAKINQQNQELEQTLAQLQKTQLQLVQQEKMSALGNLVAGIAHEINNPLGFVGGNVAELNSCLEELVTHLALYRQQASAATIEAHAEEIQLDFLLSDLPKMLESMAAGCDRIRNISVSLRSFARADKETKVAFNLHEGLDSTLLILKHRLKANQQRPAIQVHKQYGNLPDVFCFPGQLNQVFMNLLANAIDALDDNSHHKSYHTLETHPNQITITTWFEQDHVTIHVRDNGPGIPEDIQPYIFDHLYTTKEIGKGTGLGLAIVQQIIVDTHGGQITVDSSPDQGTEFILTLPVTAPQ